MGLFAALRWQFQESCGRAGIKCTEVLPEEELSLSKDAGIALFRVAQESMTNILKHAQATHAELKVHIDGRDLVMMIADDGVGAADPNVRGQGWASMRHRVESFGGQWHVHTGPAVRGTKIDVRLPLERIRAPDA
jgi:signal transduction histidine kinase